MRTILQIDKDITANRRVLRRRRPIQNTLSAADWQAAWDAEPELARREHALFLERGLAQVEGRRRSCA